MADKDPKTPRKGPMPDPHADEPIPRPDSHTRDSPDARRPRPDQYEDLGPLPALFGAAGAEARAYASDDPAVAEEAIRRGAEAEGLETAQIFGLLVATIVVLILIVVGVFIMVLWQGQGEDVARQAELTYPEIADLRRADAEALTTYGRVPGRDGVFRIPIDRAQALMAAEARAVDPPEDARQLADNRIGFNLDFPRMAAPGVIPHPESPFIEDEENDEPLEQEEAAEAPQADPVNGPDVGEADDPDPDA